MGADICQPVRVPAWVFERGVLGVLQVAADGTGLQEAVDQLSWGESVAVLDVGGYGDGDPRAMRAIAANISSGGVEPSA
ncbi:hypothetical protein GCM10027612_16720 [Microbispora bryophytorum subsp. camponoti]